MGIFNKKKPIIEFTGKVIESIGVSIPIGVYLTVLATDNDNITLTNSSLSFALKKSQIIHAHVSFEQTTIMQNKSVIGRGIVGATLAGSAGAIIGSASGVGSKKGLEFKNFAHLLFLSNDKKECTLVFSVDEYEFRKADKFARAVNPAQTGTIQL